MAIAKGTNGLLAGGLRRIAVVSTWPKTKNAEYENIQRIVEASREIGIECLVVDDLGFPVGEFTGPEVAPPDKRIDHTSVALVIYLHYTSPKLIDCFSYFTLWNPADFFLRNGYASGMDNLVSHDDYLHIDSPNIGRHLMRALRKFGRSVEPRLPLHTTVDGPILEPRTGDYRLFYSGINWERITGKPGRYDRLLNRLDDTKLLAIFGPTVFSGAKVWDGFASYRGEIPFDGLSTIYAINACGISLVFSSLQHQLCSAQSNRFFESLAAGALIITHSNEIVRKSFGDTLLYIDTVDQDLMFERVMEHYNWAAANPGKAAAMAKAAQRIFLDRYRLRSQIAEIVRSHDARVAEIAAAGQRELPTFEILLNAVGTPGAELSGCLAKMASQTAVRASLSVICRKSQIPEIRSAVAQHAPGLMESTRYFEVGEPSIDSALRREATGSSVHRALAASSAAFFVFASPEGHWFHNHLAELARALSTTGAPCAITGMIDESKTYGEGVTNRVLTGLRVSDWERLLSERAGGALGFAAFSMSVFDKDDMTVLADIDFLEEHYFLLKSVRTAEPAETGKPTYVRQLAFSGRSYSYAVTPRLQAHYMQDDLLDHTIPQSSLARRMLGFLTGPSSPLHDDHISPPTYVAPRYAIGTRLSLGHKGKGREFICTSWHESEKDFSWIMGRAGGVILPLDEVVDSLTAILRFASAPLDAGERQMVSLLVNGVAAARWSVPDSEPRIAFAVFPGHLALPERRLRLEIVPSAFKKFPNDPRVLSLRLFDVALRPTRDGDLTNHMRVHRESAFDETSYLSAIPEAGHAVREGRAESGLMHYLETGFSMGHDWVAR